MLLGEIEERERTAAELERLQQPDRAAALRSEAALARRYLVGTDGADVQGSDPR